MTLPAKSLVPQPATPPSEDDARLGDLPLPKESFDRVLDLLDHPPRPTDALRRLRGTTQAPSGG